MLEARFFKLEIKLKKPLLFLIASFPYHPLSAHNIIFISLIRFRDSFADNSWILNAVSRLNEFFPCFSIYYV